MFSETGCRRQRPVCVCVSVHLDFSEHVESVSLQRHGSTKMLFWTSTDTQTQTQTDWARILSLRADPLVSAHTFVSCHEQWPSLTAAEAAWHRWVTLLYTIYGTIVHFANCPDWLTVAVYVVGWTSSLIKTQKHNCDIDVSHRKL